MLDVGCRIALGVGNLDLRMTGENFFLQREKKSRGGRERNSDWGMLRFQAKNEGEVVTFPEIMLVFGLIIRVVTARLDTRFLGLSG